MKRDDDSNDDGVDDQDCHNDEDDAGGDDGAQADARERAGHDMLVDSDDHAPEQNNAELENGSETRSEDGKPAIEN